MTRVGYIWAAAHNYFIVIDFSDDCFHREGWNVTQCQSNVFKHLLVAASSVCPFVTVKVFGFRRRRSGKLTSNSCVDILSNE